MHDHRISTRLLPLNGWCVFLDIIVQYVLTVVSRPPVVYLTRLFSLNCLVLLDDSLFGGGSTRLLLLASPSIYRL
jgi:hypothetical protein